MDTKKNRQFFLVLVPHQDARAELQKYSDSMIKNGLSGVYSFPHAAPLASLLKPLNVNELKQTARSLRDYAGKEKFLAAETSVCEFNTGGEKMNLFGPRLNLKNPLNVYNNGHKKIDKFDSFFSEVIIGSFLLPKTSEQSRILLQLQINKEISFRAAAIANMAICPVTINDESGYKWKIGKLCWLPRPNMLS